MRCSQAHAFTCTVLVRGPPPPNGGGGVDWGVGYVCGAPAERFRCVQESLCSRCAQIDQVVVTCNESLALSIMSALLDKSFHFQPICPIASNTARENKRKMEGEEVGGTETTTTNNPPPPPSHICELSGAASSSNGLRPISIFISTLRVKWIIYWSDNHHPSPPIPPLCRV